MIKKLILAIICITLLANVNLSNIYYLYKFLGVI